MAHPVASAQACIRLLHASISASEQLPSARHFRSACWQPVNRLVQSATCRRGAQQQGGAQVGDMQGCARLEVAQGGARHGQGGAGLGMQAAPTVCSRCSCAGSGAAITGSACLGSGATLGSCVDEPPLEDTQERGSHNVAVSAVGAISPSLRLPPPQLPARPITTSPLLNSSEARTPGHHTRQLPAAQPKPPTGDASGCAEAVLQPLMGSMCPASMAIHVQQH